MIEEFINPTLLEEHVDQENFVDIMCKNYTTVNVEVESDSEIETVNVIHEEILLNIETIEIMCKNYKDE